MEDTSFPETVTMIILHLDVINYENLLCYLANYRYIHANKLNAGHMMHNI